tara:strand:+ start:604 stop:996 length:393 start_codon:yes stop_codon:yes gene_type:complete
MARDISLGDIGDFLEGEVVALVKETTLAWHGLLKTREASSSGGIGTPVETGRLINSWQTDISEKFKGRIFTNLEYAEPVVYGKNLPPSWGGQYRTKPKQGTKPGYPDLIAKEVARKFVPKLKADIRRRRG